MQRKFFKKATISGFQTTYKKNRFREKDIEFLEIRVLLKFAEKFSAYRKRYGIISANFAEITFDFLRIRKEP